MNYTAAEVAQRVGGTLEGDATAQVTKLARIEDADAGSMSFLHAPKYFPYLYQTGASVVLVPQDFKPEQAVSATLIRVQNPYAGFGVFLQEEYLTRTNRKGHQTPFHQGHQVQLAEDCFIAAFAYLDDGAQVGANSQIHPYVYVGRNVQIGEDCILYPGAVVYDDCVIGDRCIVHGGAVIGSDGFGFLQNEQHENVKIPQLGNVILEDDVEVGANTTIDRATLGSTIIRRGVKLDNQVMVAHNSEVGAQSVMAAQSGVSGSTKLGHNCMVGGQVGIVGHLTIPPGSQFGAKSGVSKAPSQPGESWRGSPARPLREQLKHEALSHQLPDLLARIKALEAQLAQLTQEDAASASTGNAANA